MSLQLPKPFRSVETSRRRQFNSINWASFSLLSRSSTPIDECAYERERGVRRQQPAADQRLQNHVFRSYGHLQRMRFKCLSLSSLRWILCNRNEENKRRHVRQRRQYWWWESFGVSYSVDESKNRWRQEVAALPVDEIKLHLVCSLLFHFSSHEQTVYDWKSN